MQAFPFLINKLLLKHISLPVLRKNMAVGATHDAPTSHKEERPLQLILAQYVHVTYSPSFSESRYSTPMSRKNIPLCLLSPTSQKHLALYLRVNYLTQLRFRLSNSHPWQFYQCCLGWRFYTRDC